MARGPSRHTWVTRALGAAGGAVLGFGLGWLIYTGLNPVLEASTGFARELQGFLWNAVPLLTLAGALVGWLLARRRKPRSCGRAT